MRLNHWEWICRSVNVVGIVIILYQAYSTNLVPNLIAAACVLIGFVGVWIVSVIQKCQRKLSPRQAERFVKILTSATKRPIVIDALMGDQEALIFATQLQGLFLNAGWQIGHIRRADFEPPVFGVALQVKDRGSLGPSIAAIQEAFRAVRIPIELRIGGASRFNEVALQIGNKS